MLVSPHFLFRIERDPEPARSARTSTRSRRSSWRRASATSCGARCRTTSCLRLAEAGKLRDAQVLDAQVKRMLADPRVVGVRRQLRRPVAGDAQPRQSSSPIPQKFPEWDAELRDAMKTETRMFFEYVLRENRPLTNFLDAQYTFLNERLAKHYGIDGVKGPEFRRVELTTDRRGGMLSQASVLTVSSYPTRTSVGHPRQVHPAEHSGHARRRRRRTTFRRSTKRRSGRRRSLRQQMEKHRANPACASCHRNMDPLGFGLENYDGIGKWRDHGRQFPVDASGTLPNGTAFSTPGEMRALLVSAIAAVRALLTEKMLTYSLGRGLQPFDRSTVDDDHRAVGRRRLSASRRWFIEIVASLPFQSQARGRRSQTRAQLMFITRKALPRRTFLRGMGTAVALPFLDAMVPALRRARSAASAPVRMAFVYVPNGIDMRHWNPAYEGDARRAAADPAAARAAQGRHPAARQPDPQHRPRAARRRGRSRPLLRLVPHRHPGEEDASPTSRPSVSCDQLVANQIGKQTRFPSLEVGLEDARQAGDCDSGYSCAYTNNLAWRSETQPLPPILDPRALFERLFGDGAALTPGSARRASAKHRRSILDFVTDDTQKLQARPRPDRQAQAGRVSRRRSAKSSGSSTQRREGQRADRSRTWTSRTASRPISPSTSG